MTTNDDTTGTDLTGPSETDDWADHLDPNADGPADLPAGEQAWLDVVGRELTDEQGTWDGPPARLRDRILQQAAAIEPGPASDTARSEPSAAATPPAGPSTTRARPDTAPPAAAPPDTAPPGTAPPEPDGLAPVIPLRGRVRAWQTATAVAATAAAVLAGAVLLDTGPDGTPFDLVGTDAAVAASATAYVAPSGAGDAITLDISGLDAAPQGSYYAAWVMSDDGVVVPAGSFHWREGGELIELWSGVDTERFPRFAVTLEDEGSTSMSMGRVRLRGILTDG